MLTDIRKWANDSTHFCHAQMRKSKRGIWQVSNIEKLLRWYIPIRFPSLPINEWMLMEIRDGMLLLGAQYEWDEFGQVIGMRAN